MPPKKRKNEETTTPKAKRQKIEDKETSAIDSGFQNPNIDITKYILDNLKLVTKDLKALSETCSSWHVKINTYYREMFAHTLPYTYDTFTRAQKLKAMAEIAQVRKHISDIQLFELDRSLGTKSVYKSVPWCPNIVFIVNDGHYVVDLRKEDPIVFNTTGKRISNACRNIFAANAHRKQVLVTQNAVPDQNYKSANEKSKLNSRNQMLYIYDVSNDGKVDLARKIDIQSVRTCMLAAFLQDDGTVWLASTFKVEIFRHNDSVETYDYPDTLGDEPDRNIMGFIEHNGVVKFLIQDLSDDDTYPVTFIYNSKTRQHEELPVICHYEATIDVTYTPDSLQFYDNDRFCGSCTLDPTIQRQIKIYEMGGRCISMSPDGSRIIQYEAEENYLKIDLKDKAPTRSGKDQDYDTVRQTKLNFVEESVEDEAFPVVGKQKKTKKKKTTKKPKKSHFDPALLAEIRMYRTAFFWLTNDIVIVAYESKLAILDFRSAPPTDGVKSFELPFTKDRKIDISASQITRLSDNSFVIWLEPHHNTVAYKITL